MSWTRIAQLILPFRWQLGFCLLLMSAETMATLLMPWLGGHVADWVLGSERWNTNLLVPLLLVVLALQTGLRMVNGTLIAKVAEQLKSRLRQDLYGHVQSLPIGFFQQIQRGDIIALMTHEIEHLTHFVIGTLLRALPIVITLIGSMTLMLMIEPMLAIPVLLGVPLFFLVMKWLGRRLRPLAGEIRESYAKSVAVIDENLAIMPAIKAFTREIIEKERYRREIIKYEHSSVKLAKIHAVLGPSITFLTTAAIVIILWMATDKVQQHQLSPGELIAFLLYAGLLTRPVAHAAEAWGQYQLSKSILERMETVLEAVPELPGGSIKPRSVSGNITFQDVSFAYPDRPPVLSHANAEFRSGEVIALTGVNGAGKSTLVNLLMRFFNPEQGTIFLDGVDIQTIDIRTLRGHIANVPQEPLLVNGTIFDNIAFRQPDASLIMIEEAARAAQAWAFIEQMPNGLETIVGEQGVRLSGGQRQRLALTRALLKDPSIVILDEPTAMFDPESESDFVNSVRGALAGRTVILITHRPASLALADRILKLEGAKITELAKATLSNPSPS